jgi:tetratricopeptide (TPR) repeat protein/DNA-binding XRE family transcriptional regulator
VRPEAVRTARLEAGLTLAELAGKEVSRQQIHHVEVGRSRPSLATLQRIAAKTGKPLTYFLADGATPPKPGQQEERPRALDKLEHLSLTERWDDVLSFGVAALAELPGLDHRAEAQAIIGQACCHLMQPETALDHLRAARAYAERTKNQWLVVECTDWEAVALYLLADPAAIHLAEDALHLCRSLEPPLPGTESRILEHIAFMHVGRQNWPAAIECYRRATQTESTVRSLHRTARMYDNLKQAYQNLGQVERAAYYAHQAIALYRRERDLRGLASGENNLAGLLMRQGDLAGAEEALERALEHFREAGVERWSLTFVLHSFGQLRLRQGQLDEAEDFLRSGLEKAQELGEVLPEAMVHQALGQLHVRRDEWAEARREYELAISMLERLDAISALRSCHLEFAEALRARQDTEGAMEHFAAAARIGEPAGAVVPEWLMPASYQRPPAVEA